MQHLLSQFFRPPFTVLGRQKNCHEIPCRRHSSLTFAPASASFRTLGRYSMKVVADGGMPIESRVDINTGKVVVRSITTGAGQVGYTSIGPTTNLASRMQAVSPTGSIVVSESAAGWP